MRLPLASRRIPALLVLAAALCAAPAAQAAPVQFTLGPGSFIVGSGYGVEVNEFDQVATLLDVSFSADASPQSFSLLQVGNAFSFTFGRIVLRESRTVSPGEIDNLGVAAVFQFADPLSGIRAVTATGTATPGSINDVAIDYAIDWTDRDVAFGNGGLFRIEMSDVAFRQPNTALDVTATITLLAAPVLGAVPEPQALALALAALLAAGAATRRRTA